MADLSAFTSVTTSFRSVFGNKRIVAGYVTLGDGASTWPSGGLSLQASDLGIGGITYIVFQPGSLNYTYNYSTKKIDGYSCGTQNLAQVGSTVEVVASGEKVYFYCIGYGKG
jgi:hypothetical protein